MTETSALRGRSVVALIAAIVAVTVALVIAGFAWGSALSKADRPSDPAVDPSSVFPNAADFCYVQMMMPHHQQAIDMSTILLEKSGVSERSKEFAEFVASDQAREVDAALAWTEAWRSEFDTAPPSVPLEPLATSHGHDAAEPEVEPTSAVVDTDQIVDCGEASDPERFAGMAGMLTPTQLDALRAAPTHEAEVLYLQLMIPHHEGALTMSRDVVLSGANYFTIQMARHILNEQQREIEAMTRMIDDIS